MTNVVVLHSSPLRAEVSISRRLTAEVLIRLARSEPGIAFVQRDLAAEAPSHVGAALLGGVRKPEGERTPEETNAVALSNGMIDQLFWADIFVIGAPMYNFGIPTVLKTWIDNISIPGRTFRYDSAGKAHGMVPGKRGLVVTSRGGDYGGTGASPGNYADPQVRIALALLGILDLHVIAADWQSLFPEARRDGLEIVRRRIVELVAA